MVSAMVSGRLGPLTGLANLPRLRQRVEQRLRVDLLVALLERYRACAIAGHARCHRSEGLREYRRLVVLAAVAEELLAGA